MNEMTWIMSEGGPLICAEARFASTWGGISRLTIADGGASSDYDRACRTKRYLEPITFAGGSGLIIGDAPLDTAVWRSAAGTTFLVRIWYCEPNFDVDQAMRALDPQTFEAPSESLLFTFTSAELTIFDSVEAGSDPGKKSLSLTLAPGPYTILTKPYKPSPDASLILHRFDPM